MPRTLMPTPEDPRPDGRALPPDAETRAVLDFRRGAYAISRGSVPSIQPDTALARPEQPELADCDPTRRQLVYVPAASHCYAIVQYDVASARLVRRVVGLFGDVTGAENYARLSGYHLYDIVPATAVTPKVP
jgi:hypothetical protein